jgi:hypothetical protein
MCRLILHCGYDSMSDLLHINNSPRSHTRLAKDPMSEEWAEFVNLGRIDDLCRI